jgi:hypothetical protein
VAISYFPRLVSDKHFWGDLVGCKDLQGGYFDEWKTLHNQGDSAYF